MFQIGLQKQILSYSIVILILFSSTTFQLNTDSHKSDIDINTSVIVLDAKDLKSNEGDVIYTYMQLKESPNRKKARALAAKWARINQPAMKFKPFHVKSAGEKIPNWKSYLVLLMGDKEKYSLKKVCFSSDNASFGIVLDSSKNCAEQVFTL
jgi:hypothetical protein